MTRKILNTTIGQDAHIDPHNLVADMEVHPLLFEKWSSKLADAQAERDDAKVNMDLLYSDYETAIRDEPEEYGIERVTEGAIRAAVISQEGYQTAKKKHHDAEKKINAYTAAVRTMEHRKRMLEKLADIWLGGYYSHNMTSRRSAAQDRVNADTSKKVKKKLNRRKKNA